MSEKRAEYGNRNAGARNPGALRFIALLVPSMCLGSCAGPAPAEQELRAHLAAEAEVSPAFAVDDSVHPTGLGDSRPVIAFDGTRFLVAFSRIHRNAGYMYAVRLSPDGAPLDEFDMSIGEGTVLSAAGTDDQFAVLRGTENVIEGVRVDGDGTVLGSFPVTSPPIWDARITAGASGFLVVWSTSEEVLRYARVDRSGAVLDPGGVVLSAASSARDVAVAFDGQRYLIVWADAQTVYAARIDEDGTALDTSGTVITDSRNALKEPVVAFDGTQFVVAWIDTGNDLRASRITTSGEVLDSEGIVLSSLGDARCWGLALGSDGTATHAIWSELDGVSLSMYGVRLSPDGTVLDAQKRWLDDGGTDPAIAVAPENPIVVWSAQAYVSVMAIHGSRLDAQGNVLDDPPLQVSRRKNAQRQPSAGFDGQNYVVTWTDDRNGAATTATDIYAARVAPSGEVLDPQGVRVTSTGADHISSQSVRDGSTTLVSWWNCVANPEHGDPPCDVMAARVDRQGDVLAPGAITLPLSVVGPPEMVPAVSAGAGSALAVMADDYEGIFDMAHVTQEGTVTGPSPVGADTSGVVQVLSAFDGSHHFLVWVSASAIQGLRVDTSGKIAGDPASPWLIAEGDSMVSASMAFDGHHHVVVWHEVASGMDRIRAVRVSPDGQVVDTSPVVLHQASGCDSVALGPAAAAFDGTHTVVAWTSCRGSDVDVQAAAIDTRGAVVARFDITADADVEAAPAVASEGGERSLVVYSRAEGEPFLDIERVMGRFVELGPAIPDRPDAGPAAPDAGPSEPDAGAAGPGSGPGSDGGGGCQSGGTTPSGWSILVVLAVLALRCRQNRA